MGGKEPYRKKSQKINKINLALPLLGDSYNPRIRLIILDCIAGQKAKKGTGAFGRVAHGRAVWLALFAFLF
jgi:hypothetical protein